MEQPKIIELKKYLKGIESIKRKYITCDLLSKKIGVYPDKIADALSFFNPLISLDTTYNLLEIVPLIKKYIVDLETQKSIKTTKKEKRTKLVVPYLTIGEFVYDKMTVAGGLINKNAELSDLDLRILKKLIDEEKARRKKSKK